VTVSLIGFTRTSKLHLAYHKLLLCDDGSPILASVIHLQGPTQEYFVCREAQVRV